MHDQLNSPQMKSADQSASDLCQACATKGDTARTIQQLNSQCFCLSLPDGALRHALQVDLAAPEIFDLIEQRCPHVFSAQPVFVTERQQQAMAAVIQAIESVVAMPAFREKILRAAPAIAQHGNPAAKGVFFGYDFHVVDEKVGLIEVNTNAGGAMLNALLARSQRACCAAMDDIVHDRERAQVFEQDMINMFRQEWALSQDGKAHSASRELRTIAIVDETPTEQYLYPEFLLFQQLFARFGLQAVIAAPQDLIWRDGGLWTGEIQIDLVYNRLTDFYLEQPQASALRQAYLADAVVLTPHPQAHALFADNVI